MNHPAHCTHLVEEVAEHQALHEEEALVVDILTRHNKRLHAALWHAGGGEGEGGMWRGVGVFATGQHEQGGRGKRGRGPGDLQHGENRVATCFFVRMCVCVCVWVGVGGWGGQAHVRVCVL